MDFYLSLLLSNPKCQNSYTVTVMVSVTQSGNHRHHYIGKVCCSLLVRADYIGRAPWRCPEGTENCSSCYVLPQADWQSSSHSSFKFDPAWGTENLRASTVAMPRFEQFLNLILGVARLNELRTDFGESLLCQYSNTMVSTLI